ncbi:RNA polymerase sigma factor FliA [Variovorax paradoxus]|nr:RNA polymerase sigma factor FliA [Variovorax paradoxus]
MALARRRRPGRASRARDAQPVHRRGLLRPRQLAEERKRTAVYTAQGTIEKSHLLKQHQPMVRRIALQMIAKLPASVELDDLIQAGMIGLLDASTRYEDNRGAQFETFASQRIRGAMLDELRANDWGSRGLRQSARKVEAAIQALEHRLGRAPAEGEIAKELKMSLEAYQAQLQEIQGCQLLYVEDFTQGESDSPFLDQNARGARSERASDDPLEQLLESGFRHQLVDAIGALPERDQLLLNLYYEEELNLREIGAILEVSQSRVCQLHSQAITRLRAALKEIL